MAKIQNMGRYEEIVPFKIGQLHCQTKPDSVIALALLFIKTVLYMETEQTKLGRFTQLR